MKTKIIFIQLILLFAGVQMLKAQDRIIKRDGEIIECKVVEVGSEEIKYTQAAYGSDLQFGIMKSTIDRIQFENGQEMVIDHAERAMQNAETNSADLFLVQNKNAIKLEFIAPLLAVTSFTYERALKPGQSIEFTGAIVGLGFNNPDDALGFGLKAGYKFIRSPDHYLEGMRYAHILKGGYVRPEVAFANYNLRVNDETVTKFAILLNIGKQWVFSDVFLVDGYFGFGYGVSSSDIEDANYPYVFGAGNSEVPVAFAWGFRIGFLL